MRAAVPDPQHAAALAELEDLRRRVRRVRADLDAAAQRARAGTELPWTGPAASAWRDEVAGLLRDLDAGATSTEVLEHRIAALEAGLEEASGG